VHRSVFVFCSVFGLISFAPSWAAEQSSPLVTQVPLWEKLVEQGDATALEKAKGLVLGLQGQEKIDGLVALLKSKVKGLAPHLKIDQWKSVDQMKVAWYAGQNLDLELLPMVKSLALNSKDALVQEYSILSLSKYDVAQVKDTFDALKELDLPLYVQKALDKALALNDPKSSEVSVQK
jgi:hypothetical protein